jgi:uncharacterized protein (TIGR00369 family)
MTTDTTLRVESRFCIELGVELLDHGPGHAVLRCVLQEQHGNRHGNAHGGMIATLLDTAMGLAVRSDGTTDNVGTVSLNLHYLRPARGTVFAHGLVRKAGRTLSFCEAELRDDADGVLATGSAVFAVAPRTGGAH